MAGSAFGRVSEWLAGILRSEKLEELPEIRDDGSTGSFLSWLLKRESLPVDEAKPIEGVSLLSWLFASERLPGDGQTVPPRTRAPFLKTLFSRERLPLDPTPGEGGGSRSPVRRPGV